MDTKLFKTSVAICIATCIIALLMHVNNRRIDKNKTIESLQSFHDSVYKVENDLADIRKTMIVSYPRLSQWEARYYAPIFRDFCTEYDTPFPLVIALFGVESGYNPSLISSAGCRGLGQLGAAAASDECKLLGIEYKEGFTEWNEIHNLVLSMNRFCSRYRDKGHVFAVKSYVAGNSFHITEKAGGKNAKYIKEYTQLVEKEELKVKNMLQESTKLMYIYKGIIYERNIESTEMSRTQRTMVRRVQDQNPTRPTISVDSASEFGKMQGLLFKDSNGSKDGTK
jgi:hypothetical protein